MKQFWSRFFAQWRAFSDRLTRALLIAFGVMAIAGAFQLAEQGRSTALIVAFVIFGVLLVAAGWPSRRRAPRR